MGHGYKDNRYVLILSHHSFSNECFIDLTIFGFLLSFYFTNLGKDRNFHPTLSIINSVFNPVDECTVI